MGLDRYYGEQAMAEVYRYLPLMAMTLLFLLQSIDGYIKKCFQINFISENKLLEIFTRFFSLYVIVLEGIGVFDSRDTGFDHTIILTLSGVLLFIVSLVTHVFKSKGYNVYYVEESQLDRVIMEVFHKHKINIHRKDKEEDYIIDIGEEINPTLAITHKGFSKKYYELKFKRHKYIHNFDEIILDLREDVISLTKPNKFRGVVELIISIFLVVSMFIYIL